MSNEYPTTVGPFSHEQAEGPGPRAKPKKRRSAIDPAQIIEEGEEADRLLAERGGCCGGTRPVSDTELQALLQRKDVAPLPGIRRPRLYAVMCAHIDRERREVHRELLPVRKCTFARLVEDAYLGKFVFYTPQTRDPGPIYRDTISANVPPAGVA